MGLSTWSISVLRRLRDAIGRQEPDVCLEVGGSIGHRSAGCTTCSRNVLFLALTSSNKGQKFGVILHRLQTRYDASSWSNIIVNDFATVC